MGMEMLIWNKVKYKFFRNISTKEHILHMYTQIIYKSKERISCKNTLKMYVDRYIKKVNLFDTDKRAISVWSA